MNEFLKLILGFPTIIFTVLLGVIMLYWITVIFGFLDLDILDSADVDLDVDPSMDLDADLDLDTDVDVDADVDGSGHHSHSTFGDFLVWIGISKVPITIVASLVVLWCWFLLLVFSNLLLPMIPTTFFPIVFSFVAIFVAFIISLFITKFCLWPLTPIFEHESKAIGNKDIIGQVCVVATGYVDEKFGQANYTKDGMGLIIDIRSRASNNLKKGERTLIVGYNKETSIYRVEPYDDRFQIEID